MTGIGLRLVALAVLSSACTQDATQIVVVVDTDMQVPAELDAIRLEASGPDGMTERRTGSLSGSSGLSLPATVSLVPSGDDLGPVDIVITAELAGMPVVQRRVRTEFVDGESKLLEIVLRGSCRSATCSETESCDNTGSCVSFEVPGSSLPPFTGTVPSRTDAGVAPDAPPPIDAPTGCSPACAADETCVGSTCQANEWIVTMGADMADIATAVSVDAMGNAYVVGSYNGSVDFGSGTPTTSRNDDAFVASYSTAGTHRWSGGVGGDTTAVDRATDVLADSTGIYFCGEFTGSIDLGGGELTGVGLSDIFVARYTESGDHGWSQVYGGDNLDGPRALARNGTNLLVVGDFVGMIDFSGDVLASAGISDLFMLRLSNADGTYVTSRRIGGMGTDSVSGLGVDGGGNLYIGGFFSPEIMIGATTLTSNAGTPDGLRASFSGAFGTRWGAAIGGVGVDAVNDIVADASSRVYIVGHFTDGTDFGEGPVAPVGGSDAFVLSIDGNTEELRFIRTFGSGLDDRAEGVGLDRDGNVYVVGSFGGDTDFGDGMDRGSNGATDAFVARWAPDGTFAGVRTFGGPENDTALSVSVDDRGNVYVSGSFRGTVAFPGGMESAAGDADGFLTRLRNPGGP